MREQQTCYKRFITLLIAVNLLMIVLIALQCVGGYSSVGGQTFTERAFFNKSDRFADFYNVAQYAMDRDLTNDQYANSPPFLHFCGYIINKIITFAWPGIIENRMGTGVLFGATLQGYAMWLSIVGSVIVFLGFQCKKLLQLDIVRAQAIAVLGILCSYPFLYAVDRGNYVFFVAVLVAATMADYEEHPYRAAVWLGIAVALKLYPAVLGIIFLRDRRWKPAAVCAGTGAGLTLLSFGFFSTGTSGFWVTVQDFLRKVQLYNKVGNNYSSENETINELLLNNSMRTPMMFHAYAHNPEQGIDGMLGATAWMGGMGLFILAGILLLCLFLEKNHDVFLLCCLMIALYPLNSGIYNLAVLVVPLLYWCKNEPDNFWVPTLGLFTVICKTTVPYGVLSERVAITLQGVLSAPLLLALTVYLVWLRRAQWMRKVASFMKLFQRRLQKTA